MVKIIAGHPAGRGKREGVAAFFVRETEVAAGFFPLGAVRFDQAARIAGLRHEMRQFVEEGAGQFIRKGEQAWIEQNDRAVKPRHPGGGAQAGVPMQCDTGGQAWKFEAQGPGTRFVGQLP